MGSLSLKNLYSYSVSLVGGGVDGIYIVEPYLINGKKCYKGTGAVSDFFISWNNPGGPYPLGCWSVAAFIPVYVAPGNATFPWQQNWNTPEGGHISLSPININNNKISIKKQNLGIGKIKTLSLKNYAPTITLTEYVGIDGNDHAKINFNFNTAPIEIINKIIGYQIDLFFIQYEDLGALGVIDPPESPVLIYSFPTDQIISPIVSTSHVTAAIYFKVRMRGITSNSYTQWSNIDSWGTYVPEPPEV